MRRWIMHVGILFFIIWCNLSGIRMSYVCAQQEIQYTYDSLGRVITVTYPDEIIQYEYDENSNLKSVKTKKLSGNSTDFMIRQNYGLLRIDLKPVSFTHDSVAETQAYNTFKKKKPVIKSLKVIKKKNKRYLKIQIKQVAVRGIGGENGYQIQYATNKKFKKAKTIKVPRVKKGSFTKKQWKVGKKTYYVRVRAYLKTRTGKTIYTKYSKVKKIKVS